MSDIIIEKGIPIKPILSRVNGVAAVLKQCEVGDSFLWTVKNQSNLHASAKYVGYKIVTRKQPDGQYRIWRIA